MPIIRFLHQTQRLIAGALLIAMTVIYGINVLVRVVAPSVSSQLAWVEETVSFMMIWCSFLAASVALLEGRHVSLDIVRNSLPATAAKALRLGINVAGMLLCAWLALNSWNLTAFVLNSGQISPVMGISMAVLYLPAVIGTALLSLGFLIRIFLGDAPVEFENQGAAP